MIRFEEYPEWISSPSFIIFLLFGWKPILLLLFSFFFFRRTESGAEREASAGNETKSVVCAFDNTPSRETFRKNVRGNRVGELIRREDTTSEIIYGFNRTSWPGKNIWIVESNKVNAKIWMKKLTPRLNIYIYIYYSLALYTNNINSEFTRWINSVHLAFPGYYLMPAEERERERERCCKVAPVK